jgi:hypothetical protein
MIVDLLRNEMSRIAEPFSVRATRLFHLETLPTVWQMVSDIEARTRPGTTLANVFPALFPCGSVTGAPKHSAMRLIRALEPDPRGIYCGALGIMLAGCTHAPAVELAERLSALTEGDLGHCFFASDGASAVEIALKMLARASIQEPQKLRKKTHNQDCEHS